MSTVDPAQGARSIYNFRLGLVPQFFAQLGQVTPGATMGAASAGPALNGLMFPMDQFAKGHPDADAGGLVQVAQR